jgi:hypothetical protein
MQHPSPTQTLLRKIGVGVIAFGAFPEADPSTGIVFIVIGFLVLLLSEWERLFHHEKKQTGREQLHVK